MNLDRTLKLLDDSIVSKRGLIRAHDSRQRFKYAEQSGLVTDVDMSLTMSSEEMRRLLDRTQANEVTTTRLRDPLFDITMQGVTREQQLLSEEFAMKEKTDLLYAQFLEILQSRTNDAEIFVTIEDLIQTCSDVLDEIVNTNRRATDKRKQVENIWLRQERNTWKLLYCLYKDRIMDKKDAMDIDTVPLGGSEKEVISYLYSTNSILREYQLIVDWLERCALEQSSIQVGHFTDKTVAWENTLLCLQNPGTTAFGSGKEIVRNLDPDAPVREARSLHDLDMEDEARLPRHIFLEIRQGRIEDAQELCEHCGQSWRAAILEGWRLFEDPNYVRGNTNAKDPVEGNPRRDVWKKCAWLMADSKQYDEYTRAIAGVFCGHLESMLGPLSDSWEDLLWAYLKVQIDIRVEKEIRDCCTKNYLEMPEGYWNNKMALKDIFDELSAHKNPVVKNTASTLMCIIQKYLILDDIPELMRQIQAWLMEDRLTPHMLRFLSHVILFMRQVGKHFQEDVGDALIQKYVEFLIDRGDSQLVAFYTSTLPGDLQVILYSRFLETVRGTPERKASLEAALTAGLDVEKITCHTVETIRNRQPGDLDEQQLQINISDLDELKISALEWLTFYTEQRAELLWQANAVLRSFLAENKIECVRRVFEMVPAGSKKHIILVYGSKEHLPVREECSIREYLCHQTYLAAIDGYNDWNRMYNNRPKEPQGTSKMGTNVIEKFATEHKEQTYKAELNQWSINLAEQAKISRDLLFNILLFPGGWLVDSDTPKDTSKVELEEWSNRSVQLMDLRKLCIPDIVLLLHNVLHCSGDYKSCVRLGDEIASELRQIYTVYSNHKLAEILSKIAESSLASMNEKLDPWGYVATV